MKKSFIYTLIIFCFAGVFVLNAPEKSHAESIQDYENKIKDLEEEREALKKKEDKVEKDKSEVEGEIDDNLKDQKTSEKKLNNISEQVEQTEAEISQTEESIQLIDEKIDTLNAEIKQLKSDIKALKKRIKKREALLNDRLRSLQESGGKVPYISVILGSKSFSDLISRSSAVTSIMDQDESIIKEHFADKQELEDKKETVSDKKQTVEEEKAEQEAQKDSLKDLKAQLDEQKSEQEKVQKKLEDEYSEMEEYSLSLEEENKIIENRSASLEKAKKLAQDEISKKEAAENEAANNTANQNGNSNSGGNNNGGNTNTGGNGLFAKPVSGQLSSPFGPRSSPGGIGSTNHNGQDFSAPKGTPVTAAASGVVNFVNTGCTEGDHSCGGGYGNYIIVTHYLDGKSYDTLYGHLSSVNVSTGQSVSKGETIAGVGHTGSSTGPHLHFEVHPGGYKNPVDPVSYLP